MAVAALETHTLDLLSRGRLTADTIIALSRGAFSVRGQLSTERVQRRLYQE